MLKARILVSAFPRKQLGLRGRLTGVNSLVRALGPKLYEEAGQVSSLHYVNPHESKQQREVLEFVLFMVMTRSTVLLKAASKITNKSGEDIQGAEQRASC